MNAYQNATPDGTALVITDADSRDAAQVSGRWLKSTHVVEVRE